MDTEVTAPEPEAPKFRKAQMRDRTVAEYLDCSVATIRKWRADDTRAIREGSEPSGPPWHKIGNSIFYFTGEVDAWRMRKGEKYGTVTYPLSIDKDR